LAAGLFESHDRDKFEVYAFSFGTDTKDEMQIRLEAAFDKFIDVESKTDKEIAELSRQMQIDIAVDLAGFTSGSRTGIFALRAAPLQINYLGYPGTMGADYMDYLIADRQLIPEEAKAHYTERIVYLPSFQANDSKRKISDRVFTREELGLPQSGFVFCCFNNSYKITPSTFDGWMRILKQVNGSVLWLSETNPFATDNLRKEAKARGVDAQRLVFARKIPLLAEHLARHRAAGLFIDTLPYNAHTTASDALWAGLPVLTCTGEALASRVAASLLTAIDLPELVTTTQEDYEALAVELATNPEQLQAIRQKLERNRLTAPLFDTKLFTRHIEDAYTQMVERYQADLAPDHIYVG
jgi:predicted O-linked N-acetylglucosamine transferase (SPINDLY family)